MASTEIGNDAGRASPAESTRLASVVAWYDALTDWQRVQVGVAAMLFLVASAGYLLGLGSTILASRVEAETSLAAATSQPSGSAVPLEAVQSASEQAPPPTSTPAATPSGPLLSAPAITEVPLVPRVLPSAPQTSAAPAAPATPTKPRNVERLTPTPTPTVRRTPGSTPNATARAATPGATATRGSSTPGALTPTPGTTAVNGTRTPAATPVPTRPPAPTSRPTPPPARPPAATPTLRPPT